MRDRRAAQATRRRYLAGMAVLVWLLSGSAGLAAYAQQSIPHVGERGEEDYKAYRYAAPHKAFAIASGGTWAWVEEQPSAEAARAEALQRCARSTPQRCQLFASGDQVVFDREQWIGSWGPYASAVEAASRSEGLGVGQRFPNLHFRSAAGDARTLADSAGKVRLVHFWGSWCPPCLRELPQLQRFHADLVAAAGSEFELVMLPVRETFAESRQWLDKNGLGTLPLHDADTRAAEQWRFRTAEGDRLEDREVARFFPTTYVLDRHGVIVFKHVGPIERWQEYQPFFQHLISSTER